MSEQRHNPDLDEAMGFSPPPPPPTTTAPTTTATAEKATDDLAAVISAARSALEGSKAFGKFAYSSEVGPQQPTTRNPGDGPADARFAGGAETETVRQLVAIKELMRQQLQQAARGEKEKRGPGLADALRPVTNSLLNTKAGRIATNAYERVKPFVQPHVDRLKKQAAKRIGKGLEKAFGKGSGGKSPSAPPKSTSTKPPAQGGGAPPAGGKAPTNAGKGLTPAAEEGLGAEAAGGLEGAGAAAGAVALPVAAIVGLGYAAFEGGKALRDFGYQMEEANRKLAAVSPSQAAIAAERDAKKMFRDVASGEATAGSSAALAKTLDKLEARLAPIENAATALANVLAAGGVEALIAFIEIASPLIPILENLAKKYGGLGDEYGGKLAFDEMLRITKEQEQKEAAARRAIAAARAANAGR